MTRIVNGQCVTTQYGVGSPNGSTFTEGDSMHTGTSAAGAVAYATVIVANNAPPRIEDSVPDAHPTSAYGYASRLVGNWAPGVWSPAHPKTITFQDVIKREAHPHRMSVAKAIEESRLCG